MAVRRKWVRRDGHAAMPVGEPQMGAPHFELVQIYNTTTTTTMAAKTGTPNGK